MKRIKFLLTIIYVAVLIVMGTATFIEAKYGTPFAHREIYCTWWFILLWGVLALSGAIYILMCKERRLSVLLLHASFLIILAGALLTHLTGRSGTIHLRMSEPQDIAKIEHNGEIYYHKLDFSIELTDFQIIEDDEGNLKDFRSDFKIGDKKGFVSMNNIYKYGALRFYQQGYDYDRRGSTLMINRDPYGIPVTYCGYALLFLSFFWLCLPKHHIFKSPNPPSRLSGGRFLIPSLSFFLTAVWCLYYFILDGSWSQIPVLRHPLLIFHVVTIILAYALLLIQTVLSAWALTKKTDWHFSLLRPALCLLSIGIFLGAIWANISWGNYWTWDSKETWALITLMVYAIPMHKRSLPAFATSRVFHLYMLLAFLTVLMTYFGVNHLLVGMHSYK